MIHQPTNSRRNFNYNAFIYSDTVWESHFHGNYELIYTLKGKVELTLNGYSDELSRGELILLSPYAVHSFTVPPKSEAWVGVFSDEFISQFAAKYMGVQFSKFSCKKEIDDIIRNGLLFPGEPDRYLCMAYLYMVCSECIRGAEKVNSVRDTKFMTSVIEYISENVEYDLTLKDVAERCNYEYHYCSAVFHQCFSMNFKEFINIFRVEKACKLLMNNDERVTDISRRCGFSSIRNFNRVFKKLLGCTPNEYRSNKMKAASPSL